MQKLKLNKNLGQLVLINKKISLHYKAFLDTLCRKKVLQLATLKHI